jgi:hypothetical protein
MVVAAGIATFNMMSKTNELQDKLHSNTNYFFNKMQTAGFDIKPTQSAICAVMLYDAKLAQLFASKMLDEGIYVTGFYYPVVPKDQARIRVQISAGHEPEHIDKCVSAFKKLVGNLTLSSNINSFGSDCGNVYNFPPFKVTSVSVRKVKIYRLCNNYFYIFGTNNLISFVVPLHLVLLLYMSLLIVKVNL